MQLFQVDAFTSVPFRGNPAGVWVGEHFPDDQTMQALAAEVQASETAFVACHDGAYRIRYFTPTCEVPLCGHATLASAHILRELNKVANNQSFIIQATGIDLPVSVSPKWITITLPAYKVKPLANYEYLEAILGKKIQVAFRSDNGWIIARLHNADALRTIDPDFQTMQQTNADVLIAATAHSADPDYDFYTRVFCNPAYGILEDPVTGTAQCLLAPYWRAILQKDTLTSRQLSQRGGEMHSKVTDHTVEIKGQAVTVFKIDLCAATALAAP